MIPTTPPPNCPTGVPAPPQHSETDLLAVMTCQATRLGLTPAQQRVAILTVLGYDMRTCARLLGVCKETIHAHRKAIYLTLGLNQGTETLVKKTRLLRLLLGMSAR